MKSVEVNVNFLCPLEIPENHRFFMFPGVRKGILTRTRNGLNNKKIGESGTI